MGNAFCVRSRRIVTPDGLKDGGILVCDGVIQAILNPEEISPQFEIVNVGEDAVLPGLVDTHVHVNEPGRAEWEGFDSATRAAAAGGITTIMDMPLNSIPVTTTAEALMAKKAAMQGKARVDVGFWGGVIPGNLRELEPLVQNGAKGFKAFLLPSGIAEFPPVSKEDLRSAMPILARLGVPLLVHAEVELPGANHPEGSRRYEDYLASRPKRWEDEAIKLLISLCRETGCRVHIVHLSSSGALTLVAGAKKEGLPLSAETCPHYLYFASDEISDGSTEFKCAPPIREEKNREALWDGLKEGILECVVSDHSPCVPELKCAASGDFFQAWGGIASLQLGLSIVWTEARKRGFSLLDLARWMAANTARLAGLESRKGKIALGHDADFAVFRPEERFIVESSGILHRNKITPYLGRTLSGKVKMTFLRGRKIFSDGTLTSSPGEKHPGTAEERSDCGKGKAASAGE